MWRVVSGKADRIVVVGVRQWAGKKAVGGVSRQQFRTMAEMLVSFGQGFCGACVRGEWANAEAEGWGQRVCAGCWLLIADC